MLPSGLVMNYLHTPIHRVVPNGWIQGGGDLSLKLKIMFYGKLDGSDSQVDRPTASGAANSGSIPIGVKPMTQKFTVPA